jgi:glucose/galactose transporter
LISFVKLAFDLDTDAKAFLVTTAFYLSYFFLALPSSWILERTGMKQGMALSLLVMALGSFLFGTYATARNYPMCLTGLFIIGSGLSLLQTASNPYISIIGPIESAAARISIMGICNKLAGIAAQFVLGTLVLSGADAIEAQLATTTDPAARDSLLAGLASKIYLPYMVMTALLVVLAGWIWKSSLPEIRAAEINKSADDVSARGASLFAFPHLWLGALCIFMYVGAEVMAGDAIGTYARGFHIPLDQTKYFTGFTLGAMLLGYVIGIFVIPRYISQQRALAISAVLGILFSLGAYVTSGYASVGFVVALGLANAVMWPAIFPLGIRGLGALTEKGSAIMIMGIAGGALIPRLFATLKVDHDFQLVFCALMLLCYVYILYFALHGYRAGERRSGATMVSAPPT